MNSEECKHETLVLTDETSFVRFHWYEGIGGWETEIYKCKSCGKKFTIRYPEDV